MMNYYINFILFAFVASITPGPTNLICFVLGSKKGLFSALPFIIGASFGAACILWLSGFGLASLIVIFPILKSMMAWTGLVWISYLAYLLYFDTNPQQFKDDKKSVSYQTGALLQLLNPKTWVMAISVNGIFSLPGANSTIQMFYLAVIFFIVAIPCLLAWSFLGHSAKSFKHFPKWQKIINRCLALLLLITAWMSVFMVA